MKWNYLCSVHKILGGDREQNCFCTNLNWNHSSSLFQRTKNFVQDFTTAVHGPTWLRHLRYYFDCRALLGRYTDCPVHNLSVFKHRHSDTCSRHVPEHVSVLDCPCVLLVRPLAPLVSGGWSWWLGETHRASRTRSVCGVGGTGPGKHSRPRGLSRAYSGLQSMH